MTETLKIWIVASDLSDIFVFYVFNLLIVWWDKKVKSRCFFTFLQQCKSAKIQHRIAETLQWDRVQFASKEFGICILNEMWWISLYAKHLPSQPKVRIMNNVHEIFTTPRAYLLFIHVQGTWRIKIRKKSLWRCYSRLNSEQFRISIEAFYLLFLVLQLRCLRISCLKWKFAFCLHINIKYIPLEQVLFVVDSLIIDPSLSRFIWFCSHF